MTFNPGLNRVTIADFDGLPDGMAGSLAHEWLATWSIAPKLRAELDMRDLPGGPAVRKRDIARLCLKRLPRQFLGRRHTPGPSHLLRECVQAVHAEKMQVCSLYPRALNARLERGDWQDAAFAEDLGMALAAVVATLNLAPPESRAARPEWPDAHWERWRRVNDIILGGGVLSGLLGQQLFSTAREWLPRLGAADVRLHLFPQPRQLMLHGAARQYREGPVVVLDAGHTAVKWAWAEVLGGEVMALQPAPLLPTPYGISDGRRLLRFLLETLIETVPADQQARQFALSLSAHLDERGRIAAASAASSFYGSLAGIVLEDALREGLSSRLGNACRVKVIHEGQAAVHGLPDMDAAILLGTSVGGAFNARRT
ncbi:hypothetical protein E5F05_20305 [Deinococcus metallilatus]|uniref:Uncharacterized protein n=1 Tax=Deinococcus metallilatus TaxID=1211322 RepID=A0AAJ5JXC4_9DEIO|nr:hypothetical protein [Deinococcus metallilatus]MBB5297134.1 hypothetical protein [Deinococcus metallilatus]QBY10079.1 hypothetical protein E5F05_20305 [Deinococcus metallilatus]RXJ08334.1 hypothetical protein ERJ73_19145 [Deinococcus metallilatus]TLK21956.1 hypothetical protein FCS05_18340 [Deinococcus metallilatus]GMA17301.1 hypothetical protein GCM10025871_36320 [Deinococcus metallilatus]